MMALRCAARVIARSSKRSGGLLSDAAFGSRHQHGGRHRFAGGHSSHWTAALLMTAAAVSASHAAVCEEELMPSDVAAKKQADRDALKAWSREASKLSPLS